MALAVGQPVEQRVITLALTVALAPWWAACAVDGPVVGRGAPPSVSVPDSGASEPPSKPNPGAPLDGDGGVERPVDGPNPNPNPNPSPNPTPTPGTVADPGSACRCDSDCASVEGHAGVCIRGICMTRASAACGGTGSRAECPAGARCWKLRDTTEHFCWSDCDATTCAGTCDADGSCTYTPTSACDRSCGAHCGVGLCTPDNPMGVCPQGEACLEGACTPACSERHPTGYCPRGATCDAGRCVGATECPSWMCTGPGCGELMAMPGSYEATSAQALADGYFIDTRPAYAYLRRDLVMLIQHAACEVAAKFPGTQPIGLADLSQADGLTPGTDVGSVRHPTSTHRGSDMDLAYYQTDGLNDAQIVCGDGSDRNRNGTAGTHNDGYFCNDEANIVDWPRQAYWFAKLAVTPLVRVFGVDRTMPSAFRTHLAALLADGSITRDEHDRALNLGSGASGGWQYHHHHSHMSYSR